MSNARTEPVLPALAAQPYSLAWQGLAQARGDRLLFSELQACLGPGEILWLQGANGAGKTSLLRLISRLAEPWTGEVQGPAPGGVLFLGHRPALKDALSPVENLRAACALAGRPAGEPDILQALAALEVRDQAALRVGQLSEGQRRRVALAQLFLSDTPPVWVLDEPLAALDLASVQRVAARIDAHAAAGGLVVFSSHQSLPLQRPVATLRVGGSAH